MDITARFIEYVKIDTCSDENSGTHPSSAKQHHLAKLLVKQMEEMGLTEITYDKEHCYVYATIPASEGMEQVDTIGFISHMDTAPAMSGTDVKPRVVENYDGKNIVLNDALGIVLDTKEYPDLLKYVGQDLIVTDGTTLLGADDKAGIAEIMEMAHFFASHPEVKHGKIRIGFTPDEEIGEGPEFFDIALFGAKYAYTVDGGALGEIEFENFNAAGAKLTVNGCNVHPGSAKGKMRNAILIAGEFQNLLPEAQNPMYTEKYEGFYHLDSICGNVEQVVCDYIIRDHDMELFLAKKEFFLKTAQFLNEKYGEGTVVVDMKDSYYNMRGQIEPHMHLIDRVVQSMEELSVTPIITPIRGGTDGARLSFMGLPCPNLCTGGENFHGKYEYVSIQSMEKIVQLLICLAQKFV